MLIETYVVIKEQRATFERHFRHSGSKNTKEFYYETRSARFWSPAKRAAQFVHVNRVCRSGIYRESLRGEFNVPVGSESKAMLDTDDFRGGGADRLKNVELLHQDFEAAIEGAVEDFVDPPYTTKHNINGFVTYNQNIFSWEDQVRLAASVKRAVSRGATVMISHSDHADVRDLYSDFLSLHSVGRSNVIASKSAHRGTITEMVATNV
ncbi:DNA adenine methylase [Sulfitobacter sp. 1A16787]|uniref:DNA adenine methylase n=1 Tax=Sulfitobacter sp. 1A16787 TaxID=3368571 RepID=UPI0037470B09